MGWFECVKQLVESGNFDTGDFEVTSSGFFGNFTFPVDISQYDIFFAYTEATVNDGKVSALYANRYSGKIICCTDDGNRDYQAEKTYGTLNQTIRIYNANADTGTWHYIAIKF